MRVEPLTFPFKTPDPFLFCVYHKDIFPPAPSTGNLGPDASKLAGRSIGSDFSGRDGWSMYHGKTIPGFPAHPHCGFETVTIVLQGYVDHFDSMGGHGRFGPGDVQWMSAGSGLQHSEMFPLLSTENPNTLELFQIWLNLPQKSKMVPPHYKMLWREMLGSYEEDGVAVQVISGTLFGVKAPLPAPNSAAADPQKAIVIATITLQPGATLALEPSVVNRSVYAYTGQSILLDRTRKFDQAVCIHCEPNEPLKLQNVASTPAGFLLLEARPLHEPVVQHGPFVASSQHQLQKAINRYQDNGFGGWPYPTLEPTHPHEQQRAAWFGDGSFQDPGATAS